MYDINASKVLRHPPKRLLNVSIEYLDIFVLIISAEVGYRPNSIHIRSISANKSSSGICSFEKPVGFNSARVKKSF